MRRVSPRLTAVAGVLALLVLALPAFAQPGPPPGGEGMGPGMGGPPMGMPPMGGGAQVTMLVSDGVVYIACDGTLTAYEAKTLKQLAQVTYWTPPEPPAAP